jgi:hydroxypyruvate isomerase
MMAHQVDRESLPQLPRLLTYSFITTMPRFAANLSMMYTEVPFLERFAAAAKDGFDAVEYLFPYEHRAKDLSDALQVHGLTQALFNLPPGDWAAGERGMACIPGREAEFAAGVEQALNYALATGCRSLHAMAGLAPAHVPVEQLLATYVANLKAATALLARNGITLMIEPINTRDMPGYFLTHQEQAHKVLAEVGSPNLKVQMDFYHCQIMEGDLSRRLQKHFEGVGHVQIAGVPDRHEPDGGEVHFPHLFDQLDQLGYSGFVGCEYRPKAGTSEGLGWLRSYQQVKR